MSARAGFLVSHAHRGRDDIGEDGSDEASADAQNGGDTELWRRSEQSVWSSSNHFFGWATRAFRGSRCGGMTWTEARSGSTHKYVERLTIRNKMLGVWFLKARPPCQATGLGRAHLKTDEERKNEAQARKAVGQDVQQRGEGDQEQGGSKSDGHDDGLDGHGEHGAGPGEQEHPGDAAGAVGEERERLEEGRGC